MEVKKDQNSIQIKTLLSFFDFLEISILIELK